MGHFEQILLNETRQNLNFEVVFIEVIVCDAPMGAGKTQSAITMMNEETDNKFIFVTPYIEETERIARDCAARNFVTPDDNWGAKLASFHDHLSKGHNIATTHALFSICTSYTAELIHNGGYTLVLDEVFSVVETMPLAKDDFNLLMAGNYIALDEDGEHVKWIYQGYSGDFLEIKKKAEANTLILYDGNFLFWSFPVEMFEAFKKIYVLTYMFDAQVQRYYFDMYGLKYRKIGTKCENGVYRFSDDYESCQYIKDLKSKIHILDDEKLNRIGDFKFSLSSSWYEREDGKKGKPLLKVLGNNVYNFFRHKCKARVSDTLWTTYKKRISFLQNKGYGGGFIACNIRATNKYRNRTCLAYCINRYFDPMMKRYFSEKGCNIDEDAYALSEMIQWIWRSAIRDGKEIKVYIPSKRMRELLIKWIDEVSC